MFTNAIDPDHPLTPSELVFLNGEQFAKKAKLGNVDLLHSDEKVSLSELGEAILAAAFLAGEQAGAFHLEVRERKATLGLRKVRELFAVPASNRGNLPDGSLEATFSDLATQPGSPRKKRYLHHCLYLAQQRCYVPLEHRLGPGESGDGAARLAGRNRGEEAQALHGHPLQPPRADCQAGQRAIRRAGQGDAGKLPAGKA